MFISVLVSATGLIHEMLELVFIANPLLCHFDWLVEFVPASDWLVHLCHVCDAECPRNEKGMPPEILIWVFA